MKNRFARLWIPLLNGGFLILVVLVAGWADFSGGGKYAWSVCRLEAQPLLEAARKQHDATGRYPGGAMELVSSLPVEETRNYKELFRHRPDGLTPLLE